MTLIVLPPYFYEIVAAATAIVAYYLFWKPLIEKRAEPLLIRSHTVQVLFHVVPLFGFILDILFAVSLALFPWMIFTYAYSAPLELMKVYTSSIDNHLALSGLLVGASVGLLGLTITAASVLSVREESRRSMPRFFFWTKWMTRFSLASTTLAFGSLLVRTTSPYVFGELSPFLSTLSVLCFLFQIYLTLPVMRLLTAETPEAKKVRYPEQQGPKTLLGAIIATVGFILMVISLLVAQSHLTLSRTCAVGGFGLYACSLRCEHCGLDP